MDESRLAGVRAVISISTTTADAKNSQRLAQADRRVVYSAGIHPLYCDEPIDWDLIHELARDEQCVAMGEMGLDHHYDQPPRALQIDVLHRQLEAVRAIRADGIDKPIIVHCRKAVETLLPILASSGIPPHRMVFHCFTETPEQAQAIVDFGSWISFTGALTFKSATAIREAARLVPLDRVMVETDAPYMTPEPHRSVRPNTPRFVVDVAACLASVHGMELRALETQLDANSVRFFGSALQRACEAE